MFVQTGTVALNVRHACHFYGDDRFWGFSLLAKAKDHGVGHERQ